MNDKLNDKLNKTAISSVLALDIIDFAKKTQDEQVKIKHLFNQFIRHAVIDIPDADCVIVDTISGAAIVCSGSLEDALEDALFISITIRDEILKNNAQSFNPLYVQFGINLGPARVTNSAGLPLNVAGDGVDVAQHIKSFANPNQILVSNVYFEMASKLTQEMAQMFEKYDMHAYEHDVYAVRLLKVAANVDAATTTSEATAPAQVIANKINWLYVGSGLLTIAAFAALIKLVSTPTEPTITITQPAVIQPAKIQPAVIAPMAEEEAVVVEQQPATTAAAEPDAAPVVAVKPVQAATKNERIKTKTIAKSKFENKVEAKAESKPTESKTESKTEKPVANAKDEKAPANTTAKTTEAKTDKNASSEKSGWKTFTDSVKSGTDRKCTQAEIALNQCNK